MSEKNTYGYKNAKEADGIVNHRFPAKLRLEFELITDRDYYDEKYITVAVEMPLHANETKSSMREREGRLRMHFCNLIECATRDYMLKTMKAKVINITE